MTSDDFHEYGIFISADGMKVSAPWRLAEYGPEGPLSDEQIADLARRFDLAPSDLRELSASLGDALSTRATFNLAQVQRSSAAAQAARQLRKARREVIAARTRLADIVRELSRLWVEDPRWPEAALLDHARAALISALHQLKEVPPSLDGLLQAKDSVLEFEPIDKRVLTDERRRAVLRAIFRQWYRAGRSLGFTTDVPNQSARRGPLIDFANAVVACVTDPPTELSGETIVKDLLAAKEMIPASERFIEDLKKRNQDT
jgi:hypothetical protein